MKHTLTICMITGREHPNVEWMLDSLRPQLLEGEQMPSVIVVSAEGPLYSTPGFITVRPKPTIWQGEHRKTAVDWWAASSARNSSLCLAQTEWALMLDDRCILGPDSLTAIRDAMEGGYAVAGAYEKRHGMEVESGVMVKPGIIMGTDHRITHVQGNGPAPCPGNWCYGAMAMPLEWALSIGGYEQAMDGMGFEDVIFGLMLQNNGYPRCYDPRFLMIQDRTPEQCGKTYRREDKGRATHSPATPDKGHRSLELFGCAVMTTNRHQLWQSRQAAQAGKPWPLLFDSTTDWYDGEPIDENYFNPTRS